MTLRTLRVSGLGLVEGWGLAGRQLSTQLPWWAALRHPVLHFKSSLRMPMLSLALQPHGPSGEAEERVTSQELVGSPLPLGPAS